MNEEKQPRKKRKSRTLQIFRVESEQGHLMPIGVEYHEMSKAVTGLKEIIRVLDPEIEPKEYVIASIVFRATGSVRLTRQAVLTELE